MKSLLTLALSFFCSLSFGQISTDAPSFTAAATTLKKGTFQIESRLQYTETQGSDYFQLPTNLFRLSLGNKFELRTTNGIAVRKNGVSLANFSLGCKVQLLNKPEGKTQIAFVFDAPIPRFDKYGSSKSYNVSGSSFLTVNHQLNEKNSLGYSVGHSFQAATGYDSHSALASLIYGHSLTSRLSIFAELYGG